MRLLPALLFTLSLPVMAADAPTRAVPVRPEQQQWFNSPAILGLSAAWMLGSEQGAEPYALRVKLQEGTRIPPHIHPDSRSSTVLSGTLYVGFGDTFDENAVVAVPAGALYQAPAGVAHYLWARDGVVVYQENGHGPTATQPLPHSGD